MKKILLILLGISILIASLSIAYYFVILVPKKESAQLILEKQIFEYQKEKDSVAKNDKLIKEREDNFRESQKITQDTWNRARTECIAIANKNEESFFDAVRSCLTELCTNNMLQNKELQSFGEGFINNCTEAKIEGRWQK